MNSINEIYVLKESVVLMEKKLARKSLLAEEKFVLDKKEIEQSAL